MLRDNSDCVDRGHGDDNSQRVRASPAQVCLSFVGSCRLQRKRKEERIEGLPRDSAGHSLSHVSGTPSPSAAKIRPLLKLRRTPQLSGPQNDLAPSVCICSYEHDGRLWPGSSVGWNPRALLGVKGSPHEEPGVASVILPQQSALNVFWQIPQVWGYTMCMCV